MPVPDPSARAHHCSSIESITPSPLSPLLCLGRGGGNTGPLCRESQFKFLPFPSDAEARCKTQSLVASLRPFRILGGTRARSLLPYPDCRALPGLIQPPATFLGLSSLPYLVQHLLASPQTVTCCGCQRLGSQPCGGWSLRGRQDSRVTRRSHKQ